MDVDGLRNELEELLKKNPDENAPQGFRDRFEAAVAMMSVEGDGIPVQAQEAELQRIRDEAEAAAAAAGGARAGRGAPAPAPKRKATAPTRPKKGDPGPVETKIDDHGSAAGAQMGSGPVEAQDSASAALLQRFGIAGGVAVAVLVAAYFFLRS
jgi:hypothetical protein